MDLLNFFFNLHQIMYSFGKQREKIWGEGHFNKSSGLKDIHTRFLKAGADILAAPLTYIFNLSLHSAIKPRSWKCATVTPLHKDGSVSDPNNFRPISVLPVVMKIFEQAVHSQIYQHLSTNKLLSSHQ